MRAFGEEFQAEVTDIWECNISIHSLEEYFERNPKDKQEEPDVIDPHELMIKRLKFELSERKRFEAKKKELLQKKLKLSKENDEKKSKLDELEKQLDRFVVQEKMKYQMNLYLSPCDILFLLCCSHSLPKKFNPRWPTRCKDLACKHIKPFQPVF
ncbi:hypothetical protein KEM48_014353 [Puccinia striiformis f. sp. tritici PST-130]|nr:hypothetical protein KEM48_014353 [Puccinia striiformis f. sp. tritici PST-130]